MAALLKYSLHAQESYRHSGPILLGFSIENLSSNDVWILKWYTPLEGIKGKILEVECDGVAIPYDGRMLKRGRPVETDYVRLVPGKPERAEFDVSQVYSLPVSRACRVRFRGRIHDVVLDAGPIPRLAEDQRQIDIDGNGVLFAIN
jgi:hypothetical protein